MDMDVHTAAIFRWSHAQGGKLECRHWSHINFGESDKLLQFYHFLIDW